MRMVSINPAAPALPSRLYAAVLVTLNFSVVLLVSRYCAGAVPILMRIVVAVYIGGSTLRDIHGLHAACLHGSGTGSVDHRRIHCGWRAHRVFPLAEENNHALRVNSSANIHGFSGPPTALPATSRPLVPDTRSTRYVPVSGRLTHMLGAVLEGFTQHSSKPAL